MKEIKAIVHPRVLARAIRALHDLPHFPGLTITEALGQGRGRGRGGELILTEENLFFHKKKLLTVIASDTLAPQIVETIQKAAHTGTPGDGIITMVNIETAVRIRTGQAQNEAL